MRMTRLRLHVGIAGYDDEGVAVGVRVGEGAAGGEGGMGEGAEEERDGRLGEGGGMCWDTSLREAEAVIFAQTVSFPVPPASLPHPAMPTFALSLLFSPTIIIKAGRSFFVH